MKNLFVRAGLLFLAWVISATAQTREELSLTEAVDIAVQNNQQLRRARMEIDAAAARILQAGRIPNPEIGFVWNESPSIIKPGDANERDISLTQTIEFPTKRSGRIDMASTERELAELRYERALVLVTSQVKRAYFDLLLGEKVVGQLVEQEALLADMHKSLVAGYALGTSSYLDVVRANVELTRLRNDLIEAERQKQERTRELHLALGKDGEESVALTDTFPALLSDVNTDSLVNVLTGRSILVRIARLMVQREEQSRSLAKSSYLPDFRLGLANQRRGESANLWGIELTASLPLWFWHEPKGQVEEADALAAIALVNLQSVGAQVRTRVRNAAALLQTTVTLLRTFDRSLLADTDDIVATAINQYQNGQMDVLNLLDLHRTYRSARVEYYRALHNYAVALAELEAAAELPMNDSIGIGEQ